MQMNRLFCGIEILLWRAAMARAPRRLVYFTAISGPPRSGYRPRSPVGSVPLARSQARHRYQLATERYGAHRKALRKTASGFGKSLDASGRDRGTRMKVRAKPLRTP